MWIKVYCLLLQISRSLKSQCGFWLGQVGNSRCLPETPTFSRTVLPVRFEFFPAIVILITIAFTSQIPNLVFFFNCQLGKNVNSFVVHFRNFPKDHPPFCRKCGREVYNLDTALPDVSGCSPIPQGFSLQTSCNQTPAPHHWPLLRGRCFPQWAEAALLTFRQQEWRCLSSWTSFVLRPWKRQHTGGCAGKWPRSSVSPNA